MELVLGKNTYLTLEEADSIVNDVFFETDDEYKAWSELNEDTKSKVIYKGTNLINRLPFLGIKYMSGQSLYWPRLINGLVVDCPYEVKAAIIKQGIKDLTNNNKQENKLQELGVKTYSIKGASVTFRDNNSTTKLRSGVYSDVYHEYLERWTY